MTPADRPAGVLYTGTLRHRRLAPVAHAFEYPLFMALLDIDRIPQAMRASRLTACNRWNWASFWDADHFGDPARPLRERLADDARRHQLTLPGGPVLLLTHLRYLGYVFNPVSFFYCYDEDQHLRLVLAEVNNTFGGSHNYWLRPEGASRGGEPHAAVRTFRAAADKALYVSPFMETDVAYTFTFSPPGARLVAHMDVTPGPSAPKVFDATLDLRAQPWEAAGIRRVLARHPLMTARVTLGIHWQALRLWTKGVPVVPRPTPDGRMAAVRDVERPC